MPDEPVPGLRSAALVVLVGASGAGKSTWAAAHYRTAEIVSSDQLRAVVGAGPNDLDATADAFSVLTRIVRARLARGLTVVVDTLGLDPVRRRVWLDLARGSAVPAVAVVFDPPPALCRARNRTRDRPVPAMALTAQLRRLPQVLVELDGEGWDDVTVLREPAPAPASAPLPAEAPPARVAGLEFVLQLSRFPWGEEPGRWLAVMAGAASAAGFTGIALMDHLIQIPQVGRAWDPIPEPWVTLGLLAGLDLGLRLGTLVSPVTFRPPGVLAKAAATLDVLSGGRAFCGLGAGWWEREHLAYGLPFPSAGGRLDLLERTIATMRALWAPGTKAHRDELVELPETTCYPRPVGPLPIIVGGSGEQRTLRIAARSADGCNLPSDPATLPQRIAVLRRHCADVGRDPAEVAVTVLDVPVLGRDREEVADRVERLRGRSAAAAFADRAGTADVQITRYRRLADLGVATVFVAPAELRGPEDVEPFGRVIQAFHR